MADNKSYTSGMSHTSPASGIEMIGNANKQSSTAIIKTFLVEVMLLVRDAQKKQKCSDSATMFTHDFQELNQQMSYLQLSPHKNA